MKRIILLIMVLFPMACFAGDATNIVEEVPVGRDVKVTFDPSPDARATGHKIYINAVPTDLGSETVYVIKKGTLSKGIEYKLTATAYGECLVCNEGADRFPCPEDPDKICCWTKDTTLQTCESIHSEPLHLLAVGVKPGTPKGIVLNID